MNNDRRTIRVVAGILGVVAVVIAVGGLLLAWQDKTIPESIVAMGAGSLGALAALLANTRAE